MDLHNYSLLYSNLGGRGPNTSLPQSIRLANAFPQSSHHLDMLISAETDYFGTTTLNGMRGEFLGISVHAGSTLRVRVSFVNRVTDELQEVGPFYVTVQGLSTGSANQSATSLKAYGPQGYLVSDESSLVVEEEDGVYAVTATRVPSCHEGQYSMHLTKCQRDATIAFNLPKVHEFILEFTASPGVDSPVFFLGGRSNVGCPEPAHCSTYKCPVYFTRKHGEKLFCQSANCTDDDVLTCCEPDTAEQCQDEHAVALAHGNSSWSNLGGMGPDIGSPRSIYFKKAFRMGGELVDMEITNRSTYRPANANVNGQINGLGVINVAAGSTVDITMSFYKADTKDKVNLTKPFVTSFFDFIMDSGGMSRKVLKVENHLDYELTKHGQVQVDDMKGFGFTTFTSNEIRASSKATDPYNMTSDELDRTVNVVFRDRPEINLTLGVSQGTAARNFEFTAWTSQSCPGLMRCSEFHCPRGFKKRPRASQRKCRGMSCTAFDVDTCCVAEPEGECARARMLNLDQFSIVANNLGGQGPLAGPREIRIADIFPWEKDPVDLVVTAVNTGRSRYIASNSSKNGAADGMMTINMKSNTATTLKLRFFNKNNQKISVQGFYLTIADVDSEHQGEAHEMISLQGFDYYNVSENTNIIQFMRNGRTYFTSVEYGAEMDNPATAADILRPDRRPKAVSFYFANKSTIIVDLEVAGTHKSVEDGRSIFISGGGALSCPITRASCTHMVCPSLRRLKADAGTLMCRGETCDDLDVETCCGHAEEGECDPDRVLVVKQSSMEYRRVARGGTHSNVFSDVFPHSGKVINMVVSNVSVCSLVAPMTLDPSSAYSSLTLKPGTSCKLKFSFVEDITGLPVKKMKRYHFSFFGLGAGTNVKGFQRVSVHPVHHHSVTEHTEVHTQRSGREKDVYRVVFTAEGKGFKNFQMPSNPFKISRRANKRSASVTLTGSTFFVNFSASDVKDSNNTFFFAGHSNLQCPPRATCSDYTCPAGFAPAPGKEDVPCAGAQCCDADVPVCCMRVECSSERILNLSQLVSQKVSHRGQTQSIHMVTKYGNVFPHSSRRINMVVASQGEYYAANVSKVQNGEFGAVNVACGSTVNLTVHFTGEKGNRVHVPGFYFSLFDIDGQGVDGEETVTMQKYSSYTVVPRGELLLREIDEEDGAKMLSIAASAFGSEADNPSHPLALTSVHLNRSIAFLMPDDTGSFSLSFAANQGWAGRNLLFGGATNLVCTERALCSTFVCPTGTTLKQDADRLVCSTRTCRSRDATMCCEAESPPSLDSRSFLKLSQAPTSSTASRRFAVPRRPTSSAQQTQTASVARVVNRFLKSSPRN